MYEPNWTGACTGKMKVTCLVSGKFRNIRVNPGDGLSLGNFSNSTIVNLCWYTKASIYITCRIYYNCSFWLPEAKQSLELLGSPVAHHPQAKRRIAPSANRAKRGVVVWAQTVARRRSVLAWVEKLLVCFSCLFMFASFRVSIDLYAFLMIMMCVYIYIYVHIHMFTWCIMSDISLSI